MKFSSKYLVVFSMILLTTTVIGQKDLNLTNALIIGQMDNQEDRYSIEINMTEMMTSRGMKAIPSLNMVKLGADSRTLASDSIQQACAAKGIDTYILISVRGYDRKFKISDKKESLAEALDRGNLFELYSMDIVSVSFELKFFRKGEFIYSEIIKIGNVGGRDSVIKRFRSKVGKKLDKKWR